MIIEFPRNTGEDFLFCSGGCGKKGSGGNHASWTCGACIRRESGDRTPIRSKDWHPPMAEPYHEDTSKRIIEPGWAEHTCNGCGLQWEQPD